MDTFNEPFEKMGISDETIKGKLLRSVAKENDFGTLLFLQSGSMLLNLV